LQTGFECFVSNNGKDNNTENLTVINLVFDMTVCYMY